MSYEKKTVILGPGEGRRVSGRPNGGGASVKVGVDDTAATVSIYESLRPAGDFGGPRLHRHAFDEAFYVLEGEYLFEVEGRRTTGTVGSFLYVPAGTIHAFRHVGPGDGRMLTVCHPGGIEEVFAAAGPEEAEAMAKKHGLEYLGPTLEESQSTDSTA